MNKTLFSETTMVILSDLERAEADIRRHLNANLTNALALVITARRMLMRATLADIEVEPITPPADRSFRVQGSAA